MRAWGECDCDGVGMCDEHIVDMLDDNARRVRLRFIALASGWLFFVVLALSAMRDEHARDARELKLRRDLAAVTAVCSR